MIAIIIIGVLVVAITVLYFKVRNDMGYWKRLGVAEDPGFFPFGSQTTWDMFAMKKTLIEMTDAAYKNHPGERVVGMYGFLGTPSIVLRDPDLIKQVLVKDFNNFSERQALGSSIGGPNSKNNKYIAKMLTELRGKEWKKVRSSLTPIFTSGKLKAMVPLIHKVADACNLYLDQQCGREIEGKDLMQAFFLDAIVSTGFGFECDSFKDPKNAFKQNAELMMGKKMNFRMIVLFILFFISPKLLRWFDIAVIDKNATEFFVKVLLHSIEERRKNGTRRNDLIDLVHEALSKEPTSKGEHQNGLTPETEAVTPEKRMSPQEIEDILIANSLLLFLAGFDTTSSTAAVTIYLLAKHEDIQDQLYREISAAVEEHGSEDLTYAEIMKLSYLDMVFLESQRCYPLTHLERCCKNDYKVPGMDLVIPKDMTVRVPMPEIMRDEKYYTNPTKFNPEHFNEENKAIRNAYVTGGFGHGPRNCIALRFATLEVKLAIARMVYQFKILPCKKTVESLIPDPKSRTGQPKGGLWFTVEKREKENAKNKCMTKKTNDIYH